MFKIKKDIKANTDEEKEKETMTNTNSLNSKTVLFWGSPNSGKTSIATIIGKKLAEKNKHKNVLVIYTDENTPPIPYIFNPKRIDNKASLGNLYTPIKLTKNYILDNLTTFKDIKNLGVFGFMIGEYPSLYPNITENLMESFFNEMKEIFDYILIDGTTFFNTNQITFTAFEKVDTVIKVCTQDIKSVAYFKSQESFLNSINIYSKKTILNQIKKDNLIEEIYDKEQYILPFCDELEENLKKGDLFSNIKDKEFNKEIDKFIGGIF